MDVDIFNKLCSQHQISVESNIEIYNNRITCCDKAKYKEKDVFVEMTLDKLNKCVIIRCIPLSTQDNIGASPGQSVMVTCIPEEKI